MPVIKNETIVFCANISEFEHLFVARDKYQEYLLGTTLFLASIFLIIIAIFVENFRGNFE